jgi:dephospho-CoA kinase
VIQADELGRQMMLPGERVYAAIVGAFGEDVILADGRLDRAVLARMAFSDGRVEQLNAIVHPAVIGRQMELVEEITARDPDAVVIVESALIFETKYGGDDGWRNRFDRVVLVTASEELKVARFVARASAGRILNAGERRELEDDAYRRLERQIPDEQKTALCDYVLTNDGALTELEWQVEQLWPLLGQQAAKLTR